MRWKFWQPSEVENNRNDADTGMPAGDPFQDSTAPLDYFTYQPLPLEAGRNDIYTQAFIWPKAQSDRMKWYNNSFWGNRLPDPYVGIGAAGPHMPGAVTQKMFWTQSSPETRFANQWALRGGYYPYSMSVQQSADYIASQAALWASSAGHA